MIHKKKFVQVGAGNIGRSFLGQLFSRAGFEVVFIDVDDVLVEELNKRRAYTIEIRDDPPDTIHIQNVRAVHGRDVEACARELADCRLAGTAVGAKAIPHVLPTIARGLQLRWAAGNGPLDIIIAENIHNGATVFSEGLKALLPPGFPLDEAVGLVETSIGKMVPIMPEEVRRRDPLLVYAEAFNTLICDARGFRNPIPDVPGLEPKANMRAYVDRKLFVHNLGHACCAYYAFLEIPGAVYVWEAVGNPLVREAVRRAMWESGRALIGAYPEEFNEANIEEHIEDLLRRFANRALGDTIYRVGRDLPRKLSRDDRLVGALLFDLEHGVSEPIFTAHGIAAGFLFRATDDTGRLFAPDEIFAREDFPRGIDHLLSEVCGLTLSTPEEQRARRLITIAWQHILAAKHTGRSFLSHLLDQP
ncbi:MAG: mannitol-1-phosphate 5-dehydrogenase [Armatimonadetes bacterium]|nr:mannitol-1-phosphate 5-dehydrogenase [Armatimonadota bacterium]